jgi:hypothetical protein
MGKVFTMVKPLLGKEICNMKRCRGECRGVVLFMEGLIGKEELQQGIYIASLVSTLQEGYVMISVLNTNKHNTLGTL